MRGSGRSSSQDSCSPSAPPQASRAPDATPPARCRRPGRAPRADAERPGDPAPSLAGARRRDAAAPDDTSWGLLAARRLLRPPGLHRGRALRAAPRRSTGSTFGAEIRYHGEGGGRGRHEHRPRGRLRHGRGARAPGSGRVGRSLTTRAARSSMLAGHPDRLLEPLPLLVRPPLRRRRHRRRAPRRELQKEDDLTTADIWIPVVHVPVGLALELGKRLQLAVEGRFIDGIAVGGALQVRF